MSEEVLNNQEPVDNTPEPTPTPEPQEKKYLSGSDEHRISVRDHLKRAVKDHNDQERKDRYRSENENELEAVQRGEAPDTGEAPTETEQPDQPQAPQAAKPPTSWKREAKEHWADLPDVIKAEVLRREGDSEKGVKALKQQYADIDAVSNKIKPTLERNGVSFPDFVSGAAGYHLAMMGPQRLQVAAQLLQQYGIHPSHLLPPGYGQQQYQNGQVDPRDQALMRMAQEIDQFKQERQINEANTATTYVESVGKQMPHFEQVRVKMAELIRAGQVKADENQNPDLWDAYNKAIRLDDTIWDQVQQEKAAKAAAKKKADNEAKKKAGVSIASDGGALNGSAPPNYLKGKGVRAYLEDAIRKAQNV